MRIYSVHVRGGEPDQDLVLVKDGFCWPAFFLSVLWAAWHRLWLVALLFLALDLTVGVVIGLIDPDLGAETAITLGLAAAIGAVANDLRRWTLTRRGFKDAGDVLGRDAMAAEQRFCDRHPTSAVNFSS